MPKKRQRAALKFIGLPPSSQSKAPICPGFSRKSAPMLNQSGRTPCRSPFLNVLMCLGLLIVFGCSDGGSDGGGTSGGSGGSSTSFVSIGTAPQGGVFYTVGAAVSDVLNQHRADAGWRGVTAESTGGTLENLRLLDSADIQIGMANSTITYFAVKGEGGFRKSHDVKAVMTLFPLIATFVTKEDSGIKTIGDLRGKRVVVGPEGAGFEYFIRPILETHGLKYDDFEVRNSSMGQSVGFLQDGSVDATFIGGGLKAPAITNADSTMDVFLIPYGEEQRQKLVQELPSFSPATIPAGTYRTHPDTFEGLNVGSAHLIVRADADDDFVYTITKTIYENRATIAEKHAAAKAINERNVVRETGTEFHPGAIRYYQEAGIWQKADAATDIHTESESEAVGETSDNASDTKSPDEAVDADSQGS